MVSLLDVEAQHGDLLLADGDVAGAAARYAAVTRHVAESFEHMDDDGPVGWLFDEVLEKLAACVGSSTAETRREALTALADATAWGLDYGLAAGGAALLRVPWSEAERETVAAALLAHADEKPGWRDEQRRLALSLRGTLAAHDARAVSAEALTERVDALLAAHRTKEAVEQIVAIEDDDLALELADRCVALGYLDRLYPRAVSDWDLPKMTPRPKRLAWLIRNSQSVRRWDWRARSWATDLIRAAPTLENWMLIRPITRFGFRNDLRKELEASGHHRLAARVLLVEGRPLWALKPYRRFANENDEDRRMGEEIAEALPVKKAKLAAGVWIDLAEEWAEQGEPDRAARCALRAYHVLLVAPHPRLARQELEAFAQRHRGNPALARSLAQGPP